MTSVPPIAILGAGPSGLTLARLLEVQKIPYIVFDRDASKDSAPTGGSGPLDLHAGSGQKALREAGLYDQFRALSRADATTKMADHTGKVYLDLGGEGTGEGERPEIDRPDLRNMLLDSVPGDKVHWGYKVQEVERQDDGKMSVSFTNGKTEGPFKLVVGADGTWSKTRNFITQAKPQYSGFQYMTSSISKNSPVHSLAKELAGSGNMVAFGKEKMFIVMRLREGSYFMGTGMRHPEDIRRENPEYLKDEPAMKRWLLERHFLDWNDNTKNLIEHCDGGFHPWPLYALPIEELNWKPVPGVTLIGDAAHATVPFEGEGVNLAMTDALDLSKLIVEHGIDDLDAAVQRYEAIMLPRGIDLINRSHAQGKLFFAEDSPHSILWEFTKERKDEQKKTGYEGVPPREAEA